ncbi:MULTISPECIES: hypothetical protein [Moorena]|uniref:Uncharacterized protein n=1 Tax=Moorena producens 3L TaxID=489825 RepID=F4XQJ6_9CYAN|nr:MULTISPECIES: hypothetical protein [Moorena]NEQ15958.1 hypothetical protein [Moorena sp. SIO3E2]EGJ33120.1 hypothetical protein LYNGBM3L_52380 [Moorena producens 3L]NEP31422.1 hypothetical protein [Moorena sp. SIO3B2]NEP66469.1 hypothetical protein [Moorena sp. SIO3A5]NEQ11444.1 hypothetical protein [Moorena sp. SIO4E2]
MRCYQPKAKAKGKSPDFEFYFKLTADSTSTSVSHSRSVAIGQGSRLNAYELGMGNIKQQWFDQLQGNLTQSEFSTLWDLFQQVY